MIKSNTSDLMLIQFGIILEQGERQSNWEEVMGVEKVKLPVEVIRVSTLELEALLLEGSKVGKVRWQQDYLREVSEPIDSTHISLWNRSISERLHISFILFPNKKNGQSFLKDLIELIAI